MARASRYPLTADQIEAVASRADVSARTVRRYLGGASMLASTMRRVAAALAALGFGTHVRATAQAAA